MRAPQKTDMTVVSGFIPHFVEVVQRRNDWIAYLKNGWRLRAKPEILTQLINHYK